MAGEIYTLTELTAAGEASTSKVWLGAEYDALSNASYAPRKIEKVELTKMLPFISRTLPTVMHGTTFTTYATSVLAADALTAGDTLFLPAVTLSVATAMNIDVNNVTIVCPFGRCTLQRATNTTNIDWLMYVTGTGFRIQDVIFDGVASGTNTGRGEGMRINAAGARVVDCDFINAYTTGTATNNYALNVLTSGNRITGCNFSDGSYAAIRCYGSHNRFSDCRILRFDMALRYDGAGDSLFIEDFYVEDAAGLECQFLIDGGSTVTGLKFLSMRNVNMNLANYDPTASTAAIRLDSVLDALLLNCVVYHTTAGTNDEPTLRTTTVERLRLRECVFSGGINCSAKYATFTADAGTNVCTASSHTLQNGERVVIYNATPANIPGGLNNYTTYYIRDRDTNTFKLALTPAGDAVDITSNGSGTNQAWQQYSTVSLRDCVLGRECSESQALIYLSSPPLRFELTGSTLDYSPATLLRTITPSEGSNWVVKDNRIINRIAGALTFMSNWLTRGGILTYLNNQVVHMDASGTFQTNSSADQQKLMMTLDESKRLYGGDLAAPATTTVNWPLGSEWVDTGAAAEEVANSQNTTAGNPTWKAKSTLAS